MSTPPSQVGPSGSVVPFKVRFFDWVKTLAVPYYIAIAAVLGALTAGFVVVIVLLILVATNFNVLGLIE
jgi:hypothetical protein